MKWDSSLLRRFFKPTRQRPIRNNRHQRRLRLESLETRLAPANVPITAGHYDPLLSGWNSQETTLTPTNVNDAGFGKLFNYTVDGYTYAQPLYVPNLNIPGLGTFNVVFAATEHDTLYAFNADAKTGGSDPTNPGLLWKRSFIDPANGITTMPSAETFSGDIVPEIGITGTPVIDTSTNTMFVLVKTKEIRMADSQNAHYVQKLYAIDLTTGNNRAGAGVVTVGDSAYVNGTNNFVSNTTTISVPGTGAGSENGTLRFDARKENDRMSTQLVPNADGTKTVYLAWASHGDNGPYHGWIIGYNASDLALKKVFNTSPNGSASGIWESGGNLGFDSQGNLYFATGNGFGTGFNLNSGGPTALGAGGGGLGYQGIGNSVSIRFRNFENSASSSTTGLGTNGAFGTDVTLPGFDLNAAAQAGNSFSVTLSYNASTKVLTETITNQQDPTQTFTTSYNIDIPATIGGSSAFVGFTGGTGGLNAEQDIKTWVFTNGSTTTIDHSTGFATSGDLTPNGGASLPQYTAANAVGAFNFHQDLGIPGDPTPAGTAAFNSGTGTYTLTASGTDIGFKANQYDTDTDRMQFVYNPVTLSATTDTDIQVRVNSLTMTDFWTKAVVMIRQSLDPQAANVESVMSPHNVSEMTWRDNPPTIDNAGNQAPGLTGAQERAIGTGPVPGWIRLVHVHGTNMFKSFWAVDNNGTPGDWQGEIDHSTTMTGEVYVGIGLSAHANGKTATATFDHLSIAGVTARTQDPNAIVTPAANGQASSIFSNSPVDVSGNWSTTFVFRLLAGSNPIADGMTFTLQRAVSGSEISESTLKLSTTGPGTTLPVVDYFTPHDWKLLDNQDADLGSGGTLLLPDAVGSAAHPHLMVETGKTGRLYLIDRDNMGKFDTRYDKIVQIITLNGVNTTPGVWGNPAFFQDGPNTGLLYYWGSSAPGQAFRITNGVMSPIPASATTFNFGFPGSQPSISSNGMDGSTGIMWAIRSDNYGSTGPETLYAFNAENLAAGPIWVSTDVIGRDPVGGSSVKFTFPIETNGHVYVGSAGSLAVYGLLPAHNTAPGTPTGFTVSQLPANQGGDTQLKLSWTLADANATLIKIERSATGATGPFTQVAQIGGDQTTYTDTGLMPLTHYWYRIRATNQAGDSIFTAVMDNTTRLTASKVGITNTSSLEVDLSWTGVISGATGNHYNVERSNDGGATYNTIASNLPSSQTTYADKTVMVGNTYLYRIHAFSASPADESFSNVTSFIDAPVDVEAPFPNGVQSADGLQFNGSALFSSDEHIIRLNNNFSQAGSVFTTNRVDTTHFSTTFWMRLHEGTQPNPADGYTFILQGNSPTAIGAGGGGLGYQNIPNSVAIKFDVFNNEGETDNSTGVFVNGHFPGVSHGPLDVNVPIDKAVVNIGDQHRKRIDINYDALTQILDVTITDEQHDGGPTSVHQTYTIDIPSIVGSGGAYVGFGGGTGGLYSLQDVLGWVFPPTPPAGVDNIQAKANIGTTNSVDLTWTDHAVGETGYNVERSLDNYHFTPIAQLGVGANSFHDDNNGAGLNTNTVYFYRVQAFNDNGGSAYAKVSATVGGSFVAIDHSAGFASNNDLQANGNAKFQDPAPMAGTIGIFTAHQDVGTTGDPGTAGTATFDSPSSKYTLTASGSDIWDVADHMHYLYKPMSGDGEIIARVSGETSTDYWTKAGIMIRADTTAGSMNAFMFETADAHNEPVFQWRASTGGGSADFGGHPGTDIGNKPPIWLRLVRSGNSFSGYWAVDINNGASHGPWQDLAGDNSTRFNTFTIPMGANVLVGLGLTAHNNSTVASVTFDHVSVVTSGLVVDDNPAGGEAGSIFTKAKEPITGSFTTSFVMNVRPHSATSSADGIDFVIQNDGRGSLALGGAGGAQGYNGISPSIAIKFNLYSQGTHKSSTGLYINGADVGSTTGQIDMSGAGIDFTQNHTYQVDFSYDGFAVLTESIKDLVSGKVFSTNYSINVRDTIGSDSAYVGFTGGTGGETAWLAVESWTATFNTTTVPPHLENNFPVGTRSGQPQVFTVAEKNQNGTVITNYRGTIHFSSSDPNAILPDDYTFQAADNGQHQFAAVLFNVGPEAITVTEVGSPAPLTDQRNTTVTPAKFTVSGFPSEVTAGDSDAVNVTALDYFGNVATTYTGTIHFSSTDPKAVLPPNSTLSGGSGTFTVSLVTAGTQAISVNDTLTPSAKGTEDGILVDPATVTTFIIGGLPSTAMAGTQLNFTVTARDAFGNLATNYTGTVSFTSDDPSASLPVDTTLTNGMGSFNATLFTAGTRHITVSDNALGVSNTSGDILVTPGVAVGFDVTVLQGQVIAGNSIDVFVTAVDAYGNEGAIYTGTVHFTSTDGAATLPPDYKFTTADNGQHVFLGLVFRTHAHQTLTVTDTQNPSINGSDDFDVL
jgi:hypothetical protein